MMCLTSGPRQQTSVRGRTSGTSDIYDGLSDEPSGGVRLRAATGGREAAITTVSVVTAGSGDTCRIERVYIDRDQAYGFAQCS